MSRRVGDAVHTKGRLRKCGLLTVLVAFSLGSALYAGKPGGRPAQTQSAAKAAQSAPEVTPYAELQRPYRIDHYTEVAENGPARGENIYYHKCWVCHNQYQKEAPHLTEFFKSTPFDESFVTTQIKDGSAGMPSFRTSLSDADVADVVGYLRSGKCCFEGEETPLNPQYRASAQKWAVPSKLVGGAKGLVRVDSGSPVEGVMVQLIEPNGVRVTVYSNEEGAFEFPQMQPGNYTLRIASPLEFKPYKRDSVRIADGLKLDDVVLEKISDVEGSIPPTPEIESEMSGEELLWNLPGTAKEKTDFRMTCGIGCHSYQQILRNRYDERSWRVLVKRMLHHGGGPILEAVRTDPKALENDEVIVKWLAKVRGPDSKDEMRLMPFPRPTGAATHVVVTEYEMPHVFLGLHDVFGDSKGNIWYTSHMTRYMGKLDSRTGIVTDYKIPLTPDALPGTHHVAVDKNGIVFLSEGWSRKLAKFDPKTEQFIEVRAGTGGFENFGLAPDGFIWIAGAGGAQKIDPETGKVLQKFPFKGRGSYESYVSEDGKYWAGGSPLNPNENTGEILNIQTGEMIDFDSGIRLSAPRRGGFDPFGNAWFGGMNGTLVELDAKSRRLREFWPPTPFSPFADFYTAMPDKNGEVWAGEMHGKEYLRYNPTNQRWTTYIMPEPFAHNRGGTWIDNSTNPVSVWYADYSLGRIIRIQPRD